MITLSGKEKRAAKKAARKKKRAERKQARAAKKAKTKAAKKQAKEQGLSKKQAKKVIKEAKKKAKKEAKTAIKKAKKTAKEKIKQINAASKKTSTEYDDDDFYITKSVKKDDDVANFEDVDDVVNDNINAKKSLPKTVKKANEIQNKETSSTKKVLLIGSLLLIAGVTSFILIKKQE